MRTFVWKVGKLVNDTKFSAKFIINKMKVVGIIKHIINV